MNIFKNFFSKKDLTTEGAGSSYIDPKTGKAVESALIYNKQGERFLKLDDNTCALVIHPDNKIEVVLTKLYNKDTQEITETEETLMAMAIYLKQEGFADLLRHEFHKMAMTNLNNLTEDNTK
jgi:hypothetical protein